MPGHDGTGPMGQGAMTGKGMGPCARGRCFGRGTGWKQRQGFQSEPLTKEEQEKILEAELKDIELERQEIQKRLKELKQ